MQQVPAGSAGAADAAGPRRSAGYQALVVGLLSLNFGIVFFDRNSLNFLMPFVQPELGLTDGQVGTVAGIFSFTWALAAFAISRLSDMVGNRKLLLVLATLAFSACSFLTGLAASFAMLIGARVLMGVAEGGVMPISHAIVAAEVEPKWRGLAQGIAQNFGSNFFGSFVAPVALVALASKYGWQHAFYLAGIPGMISAALIWFVLDDHAAAPSAAAAAPAASLPAKKSLARSLADWGAAVREVLKVRNIWVCVAMGIALVAYLVICWAFMPLYLTQNRQFDQTTTSWLMGALGISATLGSFSIGGLSDVIGRRPVMIGFSFLAVILPLGALYYQGSAWGLAAVFFVGWALNGVFPLFMATVPSESVSPDKAATVFGLCMGSCEIVGGAGGPALAGQLSEAFGRQAPLWLMVGLALIGGIFALFLHETAPLVLARRKA